MRPSGSTKNVLFSWSKPTELRSMHFIPCKLHPSEEKRKRKVLYTFYRWMYLHRHFLKQYIRQLSVVAFGSGMGDQEWERDFVLFP